MSTKRQFGRKMSAKAGSTTAASHTLSTSRKYNYYLKNKDNRGAKTIKFQNSVKKPISGVRRAQSSYRIKNKPKLKVDNFFDQNTERLETEEGKVLHPKATIPNLFQKALFKSTLTDQFQVNSTKN